MPQPLVEVEVLPGKDHMGPDGNIVGAGGSYTTTQSQADALKARGLVRIVNSIPAAPAPLADAPEERWTLKITPREYLAKYSEGPNAELAQRFVDAGKGDEMPGAEGAAGGQGALPV